MRSWRSILVFGLLLGACTPQGDPGLEPGGFHDDFERERLGEHWRNTGGPYELREGWLHVRGARNKPLWLERTLPHDVRVRFKVKSLSPEGDIKVELFGDGVSKAEHVSYTATGYVVIFGGWRNSLNVIARLDEHGADRVVGPKKRVEPGRVYAFDITRRGSVLTVKVDGEELMRLDDPDPLYGRGHDHFAFNNWESDLWFDDLHVEPL